MEDIKIQFLNFFIYVWIFVHIKKRRRRVVVGLLFFEKEGAVIARKTDLRFYN